MKKMKFLLAALGVVILASCASAGDKATGNYNGSYAIDSTATYPVSGTVVTGSINVTKVSESVVDMMFICNAPSLSDASTGVGVSMSGNTISFSYSKPTTTENDMLSFNGTITGNSITVDGVMYMSGGNGVGTFTGSK
jgi:hypothetical protein